MKTEQEPKDLSIEELFKITEVLQQTTERRMKLDIFFQIQRSTYNKNRKPKQVKADRGKL